MYDECSRSMDIDKLEGKIDDLVYDIRQLRDDVHSKVQALESEIAKLQDRVRSQLDRYADKTMD